MFATSKYAASIALTTPEVIGVPPYRFVRKKDLVSSGRFNVTKLAGYSNNEFIKRADVALGLFGITLSVNSDAITRATVQIGSGTPGTSVQQEASVGDTITISCNMIQGDIFNGWYSGSTKISSSAIYTFTMQDRMNLVARVNFLVVNPSVLNFTSKDSPRTLTISTNVIWNIE